MAEVLFDTSVLIDHLRGVTAATALIKSVKEGRIIGYISALTEAELFAGKDSESEQKAALLENLLALFESIAVNPEIARRAGMLRLKHGVELADAVIGATALNLRCKLYTKNVKDFAKMKEISVQEPY